MNETITIEIRFGLGHDARRVKKIQRKVRGTTVSFGEITNIDVSKIPISVNLKETVFRGRDDVQRKDDKEGQKLHPIYLGDFGRIKVHILKVSSEIYFSHLLPVIAFKEGVN